MPRDIIPETKSPVVELLEDARDRVATAWVRNHPIRRHKDGYAYCMQGALYEQRQIARDTADAAFAMLCVAVDVLTHTNNGVIWYNDDWRHTQGDCVLAYEVAIELQVRKEHGLHPVGYAA